MARKVRIIVYHYVRDLKNSRYPEIKGLDIRVFEQQLEYLLRHYTPVIMEDVIQAIDNGQDLPKNAFLLTFDDGYLDCFTNVFPVLNAKGVQGSFYPSGRAVQEHIILGVNKIHFILASVRDHKKLMNETLVQIDNLRGQFGLESREYYLQKYFHPTRYDGPETGFIKRVLQIGLLQQPGKMILDRLFSQYVDVDERVLARELYMSADQIRCMHKNGMHIGSHGYSHGWMNFMDKKDQELEIKASLDFLRASGINTDFWTMCYPFGGYDESLVEIIRDSGCRLALILDGKIADLSTHNRFELPRIDTNELPGQQDGVNV